MPTPHPDRRTVLASAGAVLAGALSGCTGSGGADGTPTGTPTPMTAAVPYTASDPEANLGDARDLTIWNNTERDRTVRVSITDLATEARFYRRTVTVEADTEPRFRDLIAKRGRYRIRFELESGRTEAYEWPVDGDHWNARMVMGGGGASEVTITFRIEPL